MSARKEADVNGGDFSSEEFEFKVPEPPNRYQQGQCSKEKNKAMADFTTEFVKHNLAVWNAAVGAFFRLSSGREKALIMSMVRCDGYWFKLTEG